MISYKIIICDIKISTVNMITKQLKNIIKKLILIIFKNSTKSIKIVFKLKRIQKLKIHSFIIYAAGCCSPSSASPSPSSSSPSSSAEASW